MDPIERKKLEMEAASFARQAKRAQEKAELKAEAAAEIAAERRELQRQADVLKSQRREVEGQLELLRYAAQDSEARRREGESDLVNTLAPVGPPPQPAKPEPIAAHDPIPDRRERMACPDCAELIRMEARLCRFCGWERPSPSRRRRSSARVPAVEAPRRSSSSSRYALPTTRTGGGAIPLVISGSLAACVGIGLLGWVLSRPTEVASTRSANTNAYASAKPTRPSGPLLPEDSPIPPEWRGVWDIDEFKHRGATASARRGLTLNGSSTTIGATKWPIRNANWQSHSRLEVVWVVDGRPVFGHIEQTVDTGRIQRLKILIESHDGVAQSEVLASRFADHFKR